MTTLEEEIQNQEEKSLTYKSRGNELSMSTDEEKQFRALECYRLSDYYLQIAEWLKELKAYKEADEEIRCLPIVWEEGGGIRKCIDILNKHLREVNADEDCD